MLDAPILIKVHDGRWEAYGLRSPDTSFRAAIRDGWLMEVVRLIGGVNQSVADGLYYFNVVVRDDNQMRTVLLPKTDLDINEI